MGSPMPKLRRRLVILNSFCVDCQAARRASRGWGEDTDVGAGAARLERRVSWMPGAEGAPFDEGADDGEVVERLVVDFG